MPTRKKKEKVAAVDPVFTVGSTEEEGTTPDERPSLLDESVDGLLDLREHLTRIPAGLRWPLETLPSIEQYLSNLASAGTAVDQLAIRHGMSNEKMAELRRFLLGDAYAFTYLICGHRDMQPDIHMPLAYAAAGQAGKLAWCITQSGFESYIIEQFREACKSRDIDPRTIDGVYKLDKALDWVNFRLPRGTFKSSVITHGGALVVATNDPNSTAKITAAIDDKAWELTRQIGATVLSGIFKDFFPDRVPDKASDVTKERARLGGRTISHRQTTIQAGSYQSKDVSGHYDTFWTDDLVVGGPSGNAKPQFQPGVFNWLSNMPGSYMLTRRIRSIHVGTRWPYDDFEWLAAPRRRRDCLSLVVPIELHKGEVVDIMKRGEPTMPSLLPVEAIQRLQDRTLTSDTEGEGVESWLCNYLLAPSLVDGKIFEPEIVNDNDRAWMGPYTHPDSRLLKREPYRFLLGRIKRNDDGAPLDKKDKPLDVKAENWQHRAAIITFDPWSDLDIIATLNTTWASGGKNWALTISGIDPQLTRFQLETRAGEGGTDEWANALRDLAALYKPRVIGMDRKAHSDSVIQNMLRTDKRISSLRGKVVGVDQADVTEEARIRASVAEPLKSYRLMLLPISEDTTKDYGAAITRKELLMFRAGSDKSWPILDSLSMCAALIRKVPTKEQRAAIKMQQQRAEAEYRRSVNPRLGVPGAA